MSNSNNLQIVHVEQNQSQKEVTVNQALNRIDAILNVGAIDRAVNNPPSSPMLGDLYIIGNSPTGDWSGQGDNIAFYDTSWQFISPKAGMTIWVIDKALHYTFDGSGWIVGSNNLIQSNFIAFDSQDSDLQLRLNKVTAGNVNSLLYQTNFVTTAEVGTISDNNYQIKVTNDGSNYNNAVNIDASNGISNIKGYNLDVAYNLTANGTVDIDYDNGNIHELTLTGNINNLTFSNLPVAGKAVEFRIILKQDATGSRLVSWPGAINWQSGSYPTLKTAAFAVDVIKLLTIDSGTVIYGGVY